MRYGCIYLCGYISTSKDFVHLHNNICFWALSNRLCPPRLRRVTFDTGETAFGDHIQTMAPKFRGGTHHRIPRSTGTQHRLPMRRPKPRVNMFSRLPQQAMWRTDLEGTLTKYFSFRTTNFITSLLSITLFFARFALNAGGLLAFLSSIILLNNFHTANAASLDMQKGNFVYQHLQKSLINSDTLVLSRIYLPCDLQDFLSNVDALMAKNKELCKRKFPQPLSLIPKVNKSTITDRWVTLNGVHNNAQARHD